MFPFRNRIPRGIQTRPRDYPTRVRTTARRGREARRRMLLQTLEPRHLLSNVPLTPLQRDTLSNHLDHLVHYAESVESTASLDRPLPLVGLSFASHLDLSGVVQQRLTGPLSGFLVGDGANASPVDIAAFLTSEAVVGEFDGLSFSVGPTTGTLDNGDVVIDTTLYASRSVDYTFDAAAAEELGIRFPDADASGRTIELGMTWDLRFGVDAAGEFFAGIDLFRVEAVDAIEIIAEQPMPDPMSLTSPVTLDLLINGETAVAVTLPPTASGNRTPLSERLTAALAAPLRDAGREGAVTAVNRDGHLALRVLSPEIHRLELVGGQRLSELGFIPAVAHDSGFVPPIAFGLLGLDTHAAGVVIAGRLDIVTDAGGDGVLDASELLSPPVPNLLPRGGSKAAFRVSPAVDSVTLPEEPKIQFTSDFVFANSPLVARLEAFGPVDVAHDAVTATLREGLDALTGFGGRLESFGDFGNSIAGLSSSLGGAIDFDEVFRQQLQRPVEDLLGQTPRPSWQDVRDALESVPGVTITGISESRSVATIDIQLASSSSVADALVIGPDVTDAGLAVAEDASSELTLEASLGASLQIEIDRQRTVSPGEAFAVRFDSLQASAAASSAIDFDARVGLLGLSATGSAELDAGLAATVAGGQAIAAGRLRERSMSELVTTASTGNFVIDLALNGAVGDQTLTAGLSLPPGNPFDGTLRVRPVGFDSLADFLAFGPGDIAGGLEQIGQWFGDFAAERMQSGIPMTSATRLSDVVDFASAFGDRLVEALTDEEGTLTFATAQTLASVAPGIVAVDYDAGTRQLFFELEFDASSQALTADLGFDWSLGDLVGLTTDASVELRAGVESRFRIGIDLRPLGHDADAITLATPLAALNGGRGVTIDAGDDIEVQLRSGDAFRVSFDSVTTVGQAIGRIHAARDAAAIPASDFTVGLRSENGKAVGLRMTDRSPDRGVDFRIRNIDGSVTGFGLGLVGLDEDGDGVIDGGPLHGDTFAAHLFIESVGDAPIASGKVEFSGSNFQAQGNLGFLAVGVDGGRFVDSAGQPSYVSVAVDLVDPATGVTLDRVSLADLFRSLDSQSNSISARASLDGRIELELPVRSSVAVSEFGGTVRVLLAGFAGQVSTEVEPTFGGDWTDLVQLDAASILDGLRDGLARLLDLDSESAFALGLPIVNAKLPSFLGLDGLLKQVTEAIESVGGSSLLAVADELGRLAGEPITLPEIAISLPDLVGFVASIRDRVDGSGDSFALPELESLFLDHFDVMASLPDIDIGAEFLGGLADRLARRVAESQFSSAGSLQQLESVLESALGLAPDSLMLALDTSTPGSLAVRVDLKLEQAAARELPLQLDLSGLGVAGIGNLIDVGGSSTIALSAGAAATLSLGLDVSAAGVQPFLYQFDPVTHRGTHVALTAGAIAGEIEFDASLGPIGVAIAGGSAGINRSGVAGDTDPAEFLVTVTGGSGGRVMLGDSLTLETQVNGGAFASLPLEIPRGTPITTIEYSSADVTAAPDANSLNVSEVKAAIEDRIAALRDAGIGSNLLALVGGWEGAFDLLIDTMRGEILGVPLPLIGDALADEADFLEDIKRSVVSNIADVADQGVTPVQRGIFDALGPGGLNLLQDATGDGMLTPDDVQFTYDTITNRVDFDLHLRKAVEAVALPVRFDLGLPGLNLDIDAPVQLSFGADFRLGFGVSLDEGFFFATDPSRTQLELFFDAEVPELSAAGRLAFLDIIASTIPGSPTRFDGSFIVNFTDQVVGDGNGLLALDEMASGSFSDAIEHTLGARADVDLNLVVSMGDSSLIPRMRTDLIVDWEFIAGQRLNAPEVRFENVQLNLGDFFGGFVGEVLGQVQDILRPVQPMIDLLTARLPVISDLSGSRVTLVDMARLFGRADVANFAQSVIDVNNLVTGLPQVGPDSWIDLGAFGVATGALGGFSGPGSTAGGSGPRAAVSMIDVQVESDPLGQAAERGGSRGGTWTNNLSNAKGSLNFPLLQNPMTAFQLLLGRDVDLFLYDAPALGIDFTYSQFFPIPAMPILGAEIAGRMAAVVDFAFGFDTTGIRKFQQSRNFVDIFDGFFVSDRENPDGTGRDVPEAYLRGSLTAGAKLELLVAEAGVRGGIFASVDFNLHDNDGDGRVRGGELAENFALGPIHIFDVSGRVDAGLVAFVDVDLLLFQLHEEYEIARANLLNFEIQRPAPSGLSPTEILTSRAGDVLTIHFTEQDDNYRVFPGSVPNSIVVQGQGMQTVDLIGIKEIHGNALGGDDIVTISPEVMIPVWIDGGEGNDQLTAGGGRAVLRGGPGNDVLIGGPGDDHLIGGPGDDRIFGGDGNDLLEGNDGDDYIDGGRGDDVILGGAGDDVLIGGRGNDIIEGGEGNDIIDGGPGNDILRGGPGDDQISGGRGDDLIEGGPGNDILLGGPGNDVIHGGDGDDIIDGGEGDDVIYGGAGHDIIDGGTGNDWIDGGDGDDVIRGGGGSDTIFGGAGDDVIYADNDQFGNPEAAPSVIHGGPGNDLIYGSLGDDRIFGGPGDDTIFALAGNDWIEGGDGNDTIDAGPGDDVVIGGRGDDVIDGGDGNDLLWGGSLAFGPEHFNLSDPSLFELPPRFEDAREFGGSTYFPPLLITPKIVGGLSIDGSPSDGNNVIRGGDGNDWIFGGGGDDTLYGGSGHDYLDGGAGQDALFGGDGDDVLRGGKGNDVLHGGAGIDQLYGDEGNDTLYGDAGTADGSTDGQRLFGGAGDDRLFAWAAGDATDRGAIGDELWGGPGNDFLYGNGRNDLLVGEAGNDFLHGDWARGPKYAQNPFAALNFDPEGNPIGSDDRLYGGPGNDQLFGGGGDDLLVGGPGDDWLEGQDGHDTLLGGGGIDFLVLDVDPRYQVVGGGRIDGHGDGSPDDHATDVLLINGTAGDDVIRLRKSTAGEPIRRHDGEIIGNADGGQLMVEYNQARMEVVWSEFGIPLIDQFRISGLGGDDWIEFVRGEQALDLTPLINRSRDFVAVIDGGPGNDTLMGTPGRDRIDGGRGSDVIFGFEGDDRLWGDQGANDGSVTDHDIIFAGSGNDDVLGGQGTNDLFAWSLDPRVGSSFGVYLGSDGNRYQEIDEDLVAAGITFELEDTGLNRIIGSSHDDRLYGGTGVDLLFGGGGNDQLFTRDGTPFEDLDEQQAGDEWKAYARSSQHVWYVGGTNADDVISVDFVTEPGILQGHHLVTRLTNNNGSFSFDAQVRLDFSATDGDGNLIWDPNDLLADIDGLQSDNPFTRAEALDRRFSDAVQLSRFLPSEGDFQVIIIDALAGDDVITVGPTVQKSVWIDAGEGDDIVRIESGRAILIDQTDPIDNRNDSVETAFPLVGPAVLIGTAAAPADGILTADARFRLIVDDLDQHVVVDIPATLTDGTATGTQANKSLDDLVDDINGVLSRSAAAGRVIASRSDDRIALSTTKAGLATRLAISVAPGNPAFTQLGLSANDSALPTSALLQSTTFRGLTIDNPADVDHYQFKLLPAALGGDDARITVGSISRDDGMKLALFAVGESEPIIEGIDATVGIDLQAWGVQAGTSYVLRVESNAIPTIYDVRFDFGDGITSVGVDLGAIRDFPRRDVIFGGPGNDVLQGGPGEDFIFGGPGNDVLTGGRDGGASDLLFGGEGDDTFLVIPDALPQLFGTDLSFIPTQSDRFDGGEGNNRVMFLGGDLDRRGVPIDDFVSLRFNRLLQRYEVSTLVWDINNQRFVPSESSNDLARGESLRHWHFYATTGIDSTVFDLGAGDDTVRLDPGFIFPGDSTLTTWGIALGDLQAGAEALRHIEVHAGPGNDRLFGGATDEILLGGDGADFISGGLGNDWIEGGPGNDVLAGGSAIAPDRLEFVSRSFGSGPNDTFQFASDLPRQVVGSTVRDLSFHQGDPADWYVLRPQANFQFAGQSVAALRKEMIRAAEVDSVGGQTTETGETFRFSLFLAELTGDAAEPALVPVDVLPGAAEYLLLRVDNQLTTEDEASLLPRRYELQFLAPLGDSINVSIEALAHHDDAASEPIRGFLRPAGDMQIRVGNQNFGGQGVVIPVGDFNGDGSDDYILSVRDGVDLGDGGGLVSYARLVYGGDPLLSPSAAEVSPTSGTVLIVPGRLFASGDGPRASIRPAGDIDGDGVDDLLVSLSDGVSQGDVFIVFGSTESVATIDLRDPSVPGTTIVRITGFDDRLEATTIGDVNDDGLADFVVVDGSGGHLFLGRGPQQWEKQSESVLPGGRPAFDFGDGFQEFATTHNFVARNPWSIAGGRLVFGGGTYENALLSFPFPAFPFPAQGQAVSPLIDLRGVTDPVLHFDHLLQTERRPGADIARVFVEVNGKTVALQGATNQGAGLLQDGMNPGGPMTPLSFSLDPFAGSQIRLLFDFDSVDQINNNFFGWAIDNIRVEGTTGLKIDDADANLPGTIRHLRALGDFDGDGFADFGYLSDSELRIYFGNSDFNQLSSLAVPGDFGDGALFVAERLNDDALPDAVISGPQASWLVLSNGREQPTIEEVPVGGLQPIGDFTNDGYTDLAVGVLEFTDAVTDSGAESNQNAHWVVHLHASADLPQRLDQLREATPRPGLVLQLPDAVFATASNASVLQLEAPLFGSLGDLSGDGVDDLAIYSPLRASMHVIFGDVIMAADDGGLETDGRLPIESPSPRLIPPIRGPVGPIRQVGIDLSRDPSPLLRDAVAIEGRHVDEHLQGARPIGDVNGDGFIDVVVSGETADYLVFGPFPVDGVSRIDRVANVTIVGGRVAGNYGDLDGNGLDDLVVIREVARNGGFDVTFDVHFGGNQWNRNLEQAPDLTLLAGTNWPRGSVGAALSDWDGSGHQDLLTTYDSPRAGTLASLQSGMDLTGEPLAVFKFDPTQAATPEGFIVNEHAKFTIRPIGDFDGDGRDDLAFASPNLFTSVSGAAPLGVVFLVLGGRTGEIDLLRDSDAVIQSPALGEILSPLGDINHDGYDDFAVSRSREGLGELAGGLLVFHGRASLRDDSAPMPIWGAEDAAIRLSREGVGSLVSGTHIAGPLHAVAGDIDADGRVDLIVGSPSQTIIDSVTGLALQQNRRGEVAVFFDAESLTGEVAWGQRDRSIRGSTSGDRAGQFAPGPLVDVDDDGLVDLFIGASGFDGLIDGIRRDAGRVYFIGGPRPVVTLPNDSDVEVLENFQGMLVDRQTGQPESFGSLTLEGDEAWFRFTTGGDGFGDENQGDFVRITPGAFTEPIRSAPSATGAFAADGTVTGHDVLGIGGFDDKVTVLEFDLRSLADEWSTTSVVPDVTLNFTLRSTANFFTLGEMRQFTRVGEQMFFVGTDPVEGTGLFVTDGTDAGTVRLDLGVGANPENLLRVGDDLFFTAHANLSASTVELWKSDGTGQGTAKVTDIHITAESFATGGGKLHFVTRGGREVWESDGTADLTFPRELSSFVDPNLGFDPASLVVSVSDLESQPILFLSGKNTKWTEPVLFASPGQNPNDGRTIRMVGDDSIGTRHREPANMVAFDGFLAFQRTDPTGLPSPLLVTNGVIEGGGVPANAFSLPFSSTRPRNPSGFLVVPDDHRLVAGDFTRTGDYQEWLNANLSLDRDVLYFFADGPGGVGRSLYRLHVNQIRDNGMRTGSLVTRENLDVSLTLTEVASQVPANARSLVLRGDELFFIADSPSWGSEVFRVDRHFTTAPGWGQVPSLVSDINRNAADSDPRDLVVLGGNVYFTATDGVSRGIYQVAEDGSLSRFSRIPQSPHGPEQLSVVGNRVLFVADDVLWSTDGTVATPFRTSAVPVTELSVGILNETGDGLVTPDDLLSPLLAQIDAVVTGQDAKVSINLTSAIATAMESGFERITLRIAAPAGTPDAELLPSLERGRANTRLDVTPRGLLLDLISERGELIKADQTLVDLRTASAGTYYLRVHRGNDSLAAEPIDFELQIDAPTLGQYHTPSNRNRIFGGDGDDRLSGGSDLDSMFGQSGLDVFQGESVEVFDLDPDAGETLSPPAVEDLSHQPLGPRPDQVVLTGDDINPRLRAAIAQALGRPVTNGFTGDPIVRQPIYASEVAELERLDLSGLGLSDLRGLEHATRLRFLDLSNNLIDHLSLPGAYSRLEILDLSNNRIGEVNAGELSNLPVLKRLYLDGNQIRDLSALVGITIVDDGDPGYTEAGSWQGEASPATDTWLDDYRFTKSGGSATWTVVVPIDETVRLWVTWPRLENESSSETTYQVFDGDALLATLPVFQSTPAGALDDNAMFGGRTWEFLGEFASNSGELSIVLTGADGVVVAADAVRAEQVSPTALSLQTISLLGNPINDVSRDELLGRLQEINPELNVLVTPNENAPAIVPIAGQTVRHGSLSFHDDVVVLPHQVLNGLASFMVDFWFRADRIADSAILSAAKGSGAGADNEFLVVLYSASRVRVLDRGVTHNFDVSINLNDGQWHHYAVVRDGSAGRLRLFVDGRYVGEHAISTASITVAAGGLVIGQEQDSVGGSFQTSQAAYGQLDELRIWDRFWDDPFPESQFALQAKRVLITKDEAVDGNYPDLRAYYAFDEATGSVVVDSGPNGWNGTLGNGLPESSPDRRFGPARAENAPIRQTARIELATVTGGMFDPDGERVTFTATSDNPAIAPRVSGSTLFLDYDADFATTARITVTATDQNGRQARTSFDWNVDQLLLTPGDKATSTTLTFNGGFASSAVINANYGDRVASATQGAFSYGSGVRGPATPNVVVDYLPVAAVRFWETDYGNLTNVVYRQSGATDPLEIVLTADPGYQVALHGFDLAGWNQTNRPITFLEVLDEAGTELYRRDGITVLGTGGTHSSFDFGTPLTGQTVRIRIDPGVSHDNVGINNIQFSQFEPAEGPRRFVDGSVFLDSNGNGERDGDERGVGGVVVHLLNASGQVLLCTVTDVHGNYRLSGGPATEDHTVEVILPSRWRSSGIAAVMVTSLESTVDFGVAKPLDIGGDRSGVEGLVQTFDLVTDLTLSDIVWEVRQGSDVLATGAAESFVFTPPNEGSYLVSVTARDTARGLFHSDDLWLRVRNAPPLAVILVDGEPTAELTVEQGSSLTLNSLVTDPGLDDWVSYYRWSVIDANGALVESIEGSLDESDPVPGWTFDASLAGSYEIRLSVTDDDDAMGISEPLRIWVRASAPNFDLTAMSDKTTDGSGAFAGTLIGPGGDGLLGEADFGDGTLRPIVLRADRSFEAEYRYDQPGRYQVKVRIANEEGETAERSFEVNYDPFAPTAVLAYGNINENVDTSAGPLFVTHLIAEDETSDDSHAFQLVAGDGDGDNGQFEIEDNRLMLRQGVQVDFETQDHYTIRIRTTDAVGNWHENSVTIGVNDLIELSKDDITINDGSSQRSRVTSLSIRFDQSVSFSEDAIRVIRRDSGAQVPIDVTSRAADGGVTLVDIHFNPDDTDAVDPWGSLVDGAYELNIDGRQIFNDKGFGLDAHGNGRTDETFRFGDEATDNFFRLLGDGNGDRFVNSGDFRGFRATYLADPQSEAFDPAFDLNQDGVINSADFRLFRQQYLQGIPHENDE